MKRCFISKSKTKNLLSKESSQLVSAYLEVSRPAGQTNVTLKRNSHYFRLICKNWPLTLITASHCEGFKPVRLQKHCPGGSLVAGSWISIKYFCLIRGNYLFLHTRQGGRWFGDIQKCFVMRLWARVHYVLTHHSKLSLSLSQSCNTTKQINKNPFIFDMTIFSSLSLIIFKWKRCRLI